ncbi:hypothetical protein [Streptomyces sp. NPDC058084]|uniref:hypothetical protein n=1 Tax=Streptomyces sp. NPDC058084 TaxID=3346333 RepID=UPI0036E5DB59
MNWVIAAQGQANGTPLWLPALLGGVGALLGGGISSFVAWRVLADNRKARRREEERKATDELVRALVKARQDSRHEEGFDPWAEHFLGVLGEAEAAVLLFADKKLRSRLEDSISLIIWGADDSQVRREARMSHFEIVHEAYTDAVACLGANLRQEKRPKPSPRWSEAAGAWRWVDEQVRRAENGE